MAATAHPAVRLGSAARIGMAWVTWRQHRAALAPGPVACPSIAAWFLFARRPVPG
jgi:hypothetical protein